jgi:hypothetical protein
LEITDDFIPLSNGSFESMATLLPMSAVFLKLYIGLVIDSPLQVLDFLASSSKVELLTHEASVNLFFL